MAHRIAIYLTNTDRSDLSTRFPNYAEMLETLLATHFPDTEFYHFDVVEGKFPEDPTTFNAVVLTGSAAFVDDDALWISTLFEHIRLLDAARTKLLGVCFGHQAIVAALGGQVARRYSTLGAPEMRLGTKRNWMEPQADGLRLFAGNLEQVIKVPDGMTVLGGHPNCPIALVEKGSHILGMQFHPEFPADYMTGYIDKMSGSISKEQENSARAQVKNGHDGAVFGKWAANFLAA